jgi:hypothetical protein
MVFTRSATSGFGIRYSVESISHAAISLPDFVFLVVLEHNENNPDDDENDHLGYTVKRLIISLALIEVVLVITHGGLLRTEIFRG